MGVYFHGQVVEGDSMSAFPHGREELAPAGTMTMDTARLRLRARTLCDLEAIVAMDADPVVRKFIGGPLDPASHREGVRRNIVQGRPEPHAPGLQNGGTHQGCSGSVGSARRMKQASPRSGGDCIVSHGGRVLQRRLRARCS